MIQWFYDLDIRKKLSLSFFSVGCMALLIAAVGFYGLRRVDAQNETIYEEQLVPLMKLSAAEDALSSIQMRVEQLAQDQLAESEEAAASADIDSLARKIAELETTFDQSFARATDRKRTAEEARVLIAKSERAWEALRGRTDTLISQARTGALSVEQTESFQEEAGALNDVLSELRGRQESQAQSIEKESAAVYRASLIGLLVVGGLGLGLAGFLALGVARRVSRPIQKLEAAAKRLAGGNLEARAEVEASDEVGSLAASFNNMAGQVEEALKEAEESRAEAKEAKQEAESLARQQKEEKRELAEHVDTLLEVMKQFAEGDLTVEVETDAGGDIGRLFEGFNHAVTTMRGTIRQVREAVSTAGATAEQVSASAEQLASGADQQSSQAEEVAAAMEEMTRTIADNSEAVTETNNLARENRRTARENGQVVLQTVQKMEEIEEVVSRSADQIGQLHAASDEIDEIVETIDEIAEQTNLLALNAAIEAARAGTETNDEAGQGFAVVAEEVRELAGRADDATDEIASKIEAIREQTREAVESMEAGQEEVTAGIELASEARSAFQEIVDGAKTISERVEEVAAATEEQSSTSEQVSENIESISTVSQQNARATHDIAEAIGELKEASADARRRAEQFTIEGGREAGSRESTASSTEGRHGRTGSNGPGGVQEPSGVSVEGDLRGGRASHNGHS